MADEATTENQPPADDQATKTTEPQGTEQKVTDDDGTIDWKAASRKHEDAAKKARAEASANAAAAKELAALKAAQMSDQEKADAASKAATERAEAAERRAALAEAAIAHGLAKDDLALLDGVPADQIEDRAKKLADRLKAAAPAGSSGTEVGGGNNDRKPSNLAGALAAHLTK